MVPLTFLILVVALAVQAQDVAPPGGIHPVFNGTLNREEDRITNYPITNHGGPVMPAPAAYIIWYGTWTTAAKTVVQNFVSTIGATNWWGINKPYGVGNLVYKGSIPDNYSQGTTLTLNSIWSAVQKAFNSGLPKDPNGIYLVLSSSDVAQTGFCTSFCGWHTYGTINGVAYKFGWIGVPKSTCNCFPALNNGNYSPNGNPPLDAAISVIAHELTETATDPTGNGYCYRGASTSCLGNGPVENADQCAWYFPGATKVNGYYYNLVIGSAKYLVQANWNLNTKTCAMA